jgi:hypothetical protein
VGVSCFKQAWKEHNAGHTDFSFTNTMLKAESGALRKDGKDDSFSDYDGHNAMPIFNERTYTPTIEDVGCCLRVEVSALSTIDQSVLAGPVVTFSEPVLSAPKAPPKRPLITVPGSVAFSGVRFRVLTYNVLAEMYATKQVTHISPLAVALDHFVP